MPSILFNLCPSRRLSYYVRSSQNKYTLGHAYRSRLVFLLKLITSCVVISCPSQVLSSVL